MAERATAGGPDGDCDDLRRGAGLWPDNGYASVLLAHAIRGTRLPGQVDIEGAAYNTRIFIAKAMTRSSVQLRGEGAMVCLKPKESSSRGPIQGAALAGVPWTVGRIDGPAASGGGENNLLPDIQREHGVNTVLDIASGAGFHAIILKTDGVDVTATDGAPNLPARASEQSGRLGIADLPLVEAEWVRLAIKQWCGRYGIRGSGEICGAGVGGSQSPTGAVAP